MFLRSTKGQCTISHNIGFKNTTFKEAQGQYKTSRRQLESQFRFVLLNNDQVEVIRIRNTALDLK